LRSWRRRLGGAGVVTSTVRLVGSLKAGLGSATAVSQRERVGDGPTLRAIEHGRGRKCHKRSASSAGHCRAMAT
jgi:hypothetical protein